MKEKIKKYWWVIVIVLILGFAFYWYEWRPAEARKTCAEIHDEYNEIPYERCLGKYGIEK